MARPTKLTKALRNKIVAALKTGASIADVCQHVGIAEQTYYNWKARAEEGEPEYLEFLEATTRAQAHAKATAIKTLKTAMQPYEQTTVTREIFTETRMTPGGFPYEYKRQLERTAVTHYQGDWHAAVEYLKRRHYDEWGDKARIDDWRSQAIADIKAGIIAFEALAEAFDESLATELFKAAGVPVSVGQGATGE